jgi:hypothetical protein
LIARDSSNANVHQARKILRRPIFFILTAHHHPEHGIRRNTELGRL